MSMECIELAIPHDLQDTNASTTVKKKKWWALTMDSWEIVTDGQDFLGLALHEGIGNDE